MIIFLWGLSNPKICVPKTIVLSTTPWVQVMKVYYYNFIVFAIDYCLNVCVFVENDSFLWRLVSKYFYFYIICVILYLSNWRQDEKDY